MPLDALPDPLPIAPLRGPFDVRIRPPGSKSITNRAYVIAALARGTSVVRRPLRADDCDRLLSALEALGAGVSWDGADVRITGVDGRFPSGGRVNLGDGGTPTRFTIAAACLAREPVVVDGSPRMRERPVAEGIDLLRALGARIEYLEGPERLPVRVVPAPELRGGALDVPTTLSSQFLSALMLIGPHLESGLELRWRGPVTSAAYVHLTGRVLADWGVGVERRPEAVLVAPGPVSARDGAVPPDASSAVYWIAAAALTPGARIAVPGLDLDDGQPDAGAAAVLAGLASEAGGAGDAFVLRGADVLPGFTVDAANFPDGALALAAAAARARAPSTITGLRTLRVKETDRIAALATELERVGCAARATDDALTIEPPPAPRADAVVIRTYGDHRMAMAFAILGLVRPGISVADPPCVAKSYPGFFRDLGRLYG